MMRASRPRQAGAALVTALVIMLVVLLVGVAAARAAVHAGKSARYERDRHIAFAAAEAALADAERDIDMSAATAPGRASLFDAGPAGLATGCGRGVDDLGLCAEAAGAPAWQVADLEMEAGTVGYGSFTGAQMATGSGTLPARAPRYIIEFIAVAGAPAGSGRFFRITAIGFGSREATRVVLQSFYRRPAAGGQGPGGGNGNEGGSGSGDGPGGDNSPGDGAGRGHADGAGGAGGDVPAGGGSANGGNSGKPPPGATPPPASALPAGRIAWREVANWPELHQAAIK